MTPRKGARRPAGPRHFRGERIKDEVYRQMFLLEEGRADAEMRLASALLRAWLVADPKHTCNEERAWLKKVSPIRLEMIEARLRAGDNAHSSVE